MLSANIAIASFGSSNDGTKWQLNYSITSDTGDAAHPFSIGVYRSTDGTQLDATPLQTLPLNEANDLSLTSHNKQIPPDFTETQLDYFLVAKVIPANGDTAGQNVVFGGGAFLNHSVLHIHGRSDNGNDAVNVSTTGSTLNATSTLETVRSPSPTRSAASRISTCGHTEGMTRSQLLPE